MNKLAIDTSTQTMGVALMKDNKITGELILEGRNDHSSRLMPAVREIMQHAGTTPDMLDSIVVTNGPGSYTGARIGVTTAKTMAWTLNIPLVTVSTLQLLACNGAHFSGYICPFVDARRGRVYTGLYRWDKGILQTVKEEVNILFTDWLEALAGMDEPILFISGDMAVHQAQIEAIIDHAVIPNTSLQMLHPSHLFDFDSETSAVHEVVPNYLRLTEAETKWMEKQDKLHKGDEHHD